MTDSFRPWPQKDDQLFKSGEDWQNNACLQPYLTDVTWDLAARGYKDAADIMIEQISNIAAGKGGIVTGIDVLVYPIVFLYRHYLELRLKSIIKYGNELLDIPEEFPKLHKLDKLWRRCRGILKKVQPEDSVEVIDAVEKCICEFSKIDPESMAFRYSTDRDGSSTLPENLIHINLRNLSEVMARIANYLDDSSNAISVDLEQKRSMEADF
ncbi:MAG: hypothetical protein HY664_08170 [Chloroflexi bacterium]|nr:hypothetical protein [Chloroflexota bacterium]